MDRDSATTGRLQNLISKIEGLTNKGELHWERQIGSAHRYARWNNNLLILGPSATVSDTSVQRYLFITPFDSPACIEINSNDEQLGHAVSELVATVESATRDEPVTDPFALTDDVLARLTD